MSIVGRFGDFVFTYDLFRGKLPVSVPSTTVAGFIYCRHGADCFCSRLGVYAGSSLDGAVFAVVIFVKGYQMKLSGKLFIVSFLLFNAGCAIVGNLATETTSEQKVPAEYSLKTADHKKIVVYVRSKRPNQTLALRGYLTGAINARLGSKTITSKKTSVIPYSQLQSFLAGNGSSVELPPEQIAKSLGADAVLVVDIVDYNLSAITGSSIYTGLVRSQSTLYDSTGQVIWPISGIGKSVAVGFDMESGSSEQAMARLANANAHCIVRYFYNCPKNQFKLFEETAGAGTNSW